MRNLNNSTSVLWVNVTACPVACDAVPSLSDCHVVEQRTETPILNGGIVSCRSWAKSHIDIISALSLALALCFSFLFFSFFFFFLRNKMVVLERSRLHEGAAYTPWPPCMGMKNETTGIIKGFSNYVCTTLR